ncbi:MAG: hypothetical protein H6710_01750 [Myxococcales bacterium]|nr:hypothetical protein [Myxococcales bacterium]MCB9702873.1 hypothetical protein [Myxococcales bacterium]
MSIGDKILQALDSLTTLEIVTAVGPTPLDAKGKPLIGIGDAKVMASRIRLLDGDITNKIDEAYVKGELAPLRDFHETQVARGIEIIKGNIGALTELYRLIRQVEADRDKAPTRPAP